MLHFVLPVVLLITDRPFDKVHAMKPLTIYPADVGARQLMKERFNDLLAGVKWADDFILIGAWYSGPSRERMLFWQLAPFIAAGAALEEKPADRVKWYELYVALM